jgi:hypothetical protein
MRVAYYVIFHERGWMIERHGQYYGPFTCQEEAVREAVYVADYSIRHGLEAEVVVERTAAPKASLNSDLPP